MRSSHYLTIPAVLLLTACSSSQALRSAKQGDIAELRAALDQETVEERKAKVIARATLRNDILSAQEMEARTFISSLTPCARALADALRERSQTRDAVGGEAALLLLRKNLYRGPNPERFRSSPEGAWRAIAARATETDHAQRVAFFVDDDQRVRRAALSAAFATADERDIPALLEASRLDPDDMVRSRAIATLGRIGGRRVLTALTDRFRNAEEPIRLAIVDAYGKPALLETGGLERLQRISETETGFAALHAAALLSRKQGEVGQRGLNRLKEFARHGTRQERRLALRLLPADSEATRALLLDLTRSADPAVSVIAWARLLGWPEYADTAQKALMDIAREDTDQSYEALAALAAAGSPQATEFLVEQLQSPHANLRLVAGYGLLRLGEFRSLAPLLADRSAEVRRNISCRLLAE